MRYDAHMFGLDFVIVLLVILAVVLIWRGPRILPKWGETLGRGVKATRKEVSDLRDEPGKTDDGTPTPP
jgi:Sec-independent protein translocase protein TatA